MSDSQLKIAVLSMHTSPFAQPGTGDSGGLNIYVKKLSQALAHRGHSCRIYVRKTSHEQGETVFVEPGVEVVHVSAGPKEASLTELPELVPIFTQKVSEDMQQRGIPDILHANYWLSGQAGHSIKHELGIPLITTFHTLAGNKYLVDEYVHPQRAEEEVKIAACSDLLCASGQTEADDLVSHLDISPEYIETVAPGVEQAFFNPGDTASARKAIRFTGIPADEEPMLLFVGRIQPLKRLPLVIEALGHLLDKTGRGRLAVVGGPSGPEGERTLEESVVLANSLGLKDRVKFVPPQPHHLLSSYYRAADAVVIPSKSESFGLVALEAMACGTAVVAASVGGLKEVVQHGKTGLLVSQSTPEAFAQAVQQLLAKDDHEIDQSSLAAVSAARLYSWDTAAAEISKAYERCLNTQLVDCL